MIKYTLAALALLVAMQSSLPAVARIGRRPPPQQRCENECWVQACSAAAKDPAHKQWCSAELQACIDAHCKKH
jgi:hypothetical protein